MTVTGQADHSGAESDFNPMVNPHQEDPHPFYRRARTRSVMFSPSVDAYLVCRYTDVHAVLDDPETFSARLAFPFIYDNPPEVVAELRAGGVPEQRRLVDEDSPRHRQIRALIDVGFSAQRIRSLMPVVWRRAEELVDRFTGGTADLVAEYAGPYVQGIINAVIGFPVEAAERVETSTLDSFTLSNPAAPVEAKIDAARRLGEFTRYLQALVDARRAAPRDDLISVLVHGADGIPGLAQDGAVHGIIRGTRIAGFPTTRDAITATTLLALQNPAVHEGILREPTQTIIKATEEALRRNPPNRGVFRVTTREVELGGTRLPQGARVLVLFDSANRDDTVFPDADAVVLGRPNVHDHVSFGRGLHACPGAPVARAEIQVALRTLFGRLPGLRLADGFEPTYRAIHLVRGLESLRVQW
ncbi:cytochrome P450 [Actinophytocola oryzae]|uniref:Cytochrome P450 n=1 Tax=Actinophytocola oryzae TaxID=502181 RepID=A0A4R7VHN6_9PSEU|nr:cytochrome P450 [Actinophytocola oryzae]TDV48667.1 cytochrome P450 [Actinophytocola oryzae]